MMILINNSECVYISENSSRGVRSTSKYHAKGERAVGFDKVIQKTSDLVYYLRVSVANQALLGFEDVQYE